MWPLVRVAFSSRTVVYAPHAQYAVERSTHYISHTYTLKLSCTRRGRLQLGAFII